MRRTKILTLALVLAAAGGGGVFSARAARGNEWMRYESPMQALAMVIDAAEQFLAKIIVTGGNAQLQQPKPAVSPTPSFLKLLLPPPPLQAPVKSSPPVAAPRAVPLPSVPIVSPGAATPGNAPTSETDTLALVLDPVNFQNNAIWRFDNRNPSNAWSVPAGSDPYFLETDTGNPDTAYLLRAEVQSQSLVPVLYRIDVPTLTFTPFVSLSPFTPLTTSQVRGPRGMEITPTPSPGTTARELVIAVEERTGSLARRRTYIIDAETGAITSTLLASGAPSVSQFPIAVTPDARLAIIAHPGANAVESRVSIVSLEPQSRGVILAAVAGPVGFPADVGAANAAAFVSYGSLGQMLRISLVPPYASTLITIPQTGQSLPTLADLEVGGVLAAGGDRLRILNPATGAVQCAGAQGPSPAAFSLQFGLNGILYYLASGGTGRNGTVAAVHPQTCATLSVVPATGILTPVASPAIRTANGKVAYASFLENPISQHSISFFDPATGNTASVVISNSPAVTVADLETTSR